MARNIKPIDASRWESVQNLRTANPIDSVLQTLEYFSNKNREEKQSRAGAYATAYNEFYKDIHGTTDLELIDTEIGRMQSYYSQNKEKMTPEMIENFNLLSQQAQYHKEDMGAYRTGLSAMDMKGQNYLSLVEEYNDAPDSSPEEGIRTKDMIAQELNASVVDYINWSDTFNSKYGDKLQTAQFAHDSSKINDFDDIMRTGVGMIADNHFSKEEKMMLINGINQKSMDPLNEYVNIKSRVKLQDANDARERGRMAINAINSQGKLINEYDRVTERFEGIITGQASPALITEWEEIADTPVFVYEYDEDGEKRPVNVTNRDLLFGAVTDGYELDVLLTNANYQVDEAKKEFESSDRVYMNTVGESISKNYPITYQEAVPKEIVTVDDEIVPADKEETKEIDKVEVYPGGKTIEVDDKSELDKPSINNLDKLKSGLFDRENFEKTKFGYQIREGSSLDVYKTINKKSYGKSGINRKLNRLIKYYWAHIDNKMTKQANSVKDKILKLIDSKKDVLDFTDKASEWQYTSEKRSEFPTPAIFK
tara:strand:+ start:12370 stop:13983 length:1614 start_codon:yes stop_codon:yes gene_type:complete